MENKPIIDNYHQVSKEDVNHIEPPRLASKHGVIMIKFCMHKKNVLSKKPKQIKLTKGPVAFVSASGTRINIYLQHATHPKALCHTQKCFGSIQIVLPHNQSQEYSRHWAKNKNYNACMQCMRAHVCGV